MPAPYRIQVIDKALTRLNQISKQTSISRIEIMRIGFSLVLAALKYIKDKPRLVLLDRNGKILCQIEISAYLPK